MTTKMNWLWGFVGALLTLIAMFASSTFTFNDEQQVCATERLVPSGKDRILLISLREDGSRQIEDHPKPVYGMAYPALPVTLDMPIKNHGERGGKHD